MGTSEKPNEKFFQWLWENKKLITNLRILSGQQIEIIFPGNPNMEDGPDFKNAIIKFADGVRLTGNVEVHISSRDWFAHKHHIDPKYNNVILHVIVREELNFVPAVTKTGHKIETLILSKFLQNPLQELYEEFKLNNTKIEPCPHKSNTIKEIIFKQGIVRFNLKKQRFAKLIEIYGEEQGFYIGIMEALGYAKNKATFVKLANYAPIEKLKELTKGKSKEQRIEIIKATLLGVAGFISDDLKSIWEPIYIEETFPIIKREEWQFFKVRPRGFPQYRIRSISYFLADALKYGICNLMLGQNLNIKKLFNCISQGKFGKSYVDTVILNVCLPILSILSDENDKVVELYKDCNTLPRNSIVELMSNVLFDKSNWVGESPRSHKEIYNQGLLHIFHNYCKDRKCNECPVKNDTI